MNKHVQIRDFEIKDYKVLASRAKRNGLSLSQYLRQELAKIANRPSPEEIGDLLINLPRPQIDPAVLKKAMEEARDERDSRPLWFESDSKIV